MLSLAVGLALALPPRAPTVLAPAYDTFLDAEAPDENFGRDAALVGGPKQVVLLRFPGVGWQLDPAKKVASARLELRLLSGGPVRLRSVSRVLRRWGEGTGRRLLPSTAAELPGGASWNHARLGPGGEKWQRGGAAGAEDAVPVAATSLVQNDDRVLVTGLAEAVEASLADPDSDGGLRLEFESECVFASSELPEFAPRLVVEQSEAAAEDRPRLSAVTVANGVPTVVAFSAGSVAGLRVEWRDGGRLLRTADVALPAGQPVRLAGEGAGVVEASLWSGTKRLATAVGHAKGRPVPVSEAELADGTAARLVRLLNDEAMPFSRYSFAPGGSPLRFVTQLSADPPAGTLRERAQEAVRATLPRGLFLAEGEEPSPAAFAWSGDTRDDAFLPPSRWRPEWRWLPRGPEDPVMPERGWLGPGEVLYHLVGSGAMPLKALSRVAVLFRGLDGQGLADASAVLEGAGASPATAVTNDQGVALFSGLDLGAAGAWPGMLKLRASKAGSTFEAWLPGWRVLVESARLRGREPVVEVGTMLHASGPPPESDLAAFKAVATSDGKLPAATAALVDDDPATALELAPGAWCEVDLGRDRSVASLELTTLGGPAEAFRTSLGRTGSPAGAGVPWIVEGFGEERARRIGKAEQGRVVVLYSASPTQARRVRLVNEGTKPVLVGRLRLFGPAAP